MGSPFVKHNDTQHETSQYDPKHANDCPCDECETVFLERARNPHLYGYQAKPTQRFWRGRRLAIPVCIITWAVLAAAGIWLVSSRAQAGHAPEPIQRPPGLLLAKKQCPDTATLVECRAALRKALAASTWQRNARLHQGRYGVQHAVRLASALFHIPLREMIAVGLCESHLYENSQNTSSTAAGLYQFLDSTWARAGIPGFSVYDPYANAIAAARLVRNDGGWGEWTCRP